MFFLGAILDYQIDSSLAWTNAERFAHDVVGNPADLWWYIARFTKEEWDSRYKELGLHWLRQAHGRVWRIGTHIADSYGGDAGAIWWGQLASITVKRLSDLRVGSQITRMIIGALQDHEQISGAADADANLHVKRVLGRILAGRDLTVREATDLTRRMYPDNPWALDDPLYWLGKDYCRRSSPVCDECPAYRECRYRKISQFGDLIG